ncbi:MAG: hypothetical protein QM767_04580 [Anaeromyxobacter sp.]
MAENQQPGTPGSENEGEGSRSAARRYNEGVQETVRRGDAEQEADSARQAVEQDPDTYRNAEEEGKRHSAGDLPEDLAP